MLEPGTTGMMEISVRGAILLLRSSEYTVGGLSGGVVVVAGVGTALAVSVSDGGGLT